MHPSVFRVEAGGYIFERGVYSISVIDLPDLQILNTYNFPQHVVSAKVINLQYGNHLAPVSHTLPCKACLHHHRNVENGLLYMTRTMRDQMLHNNLIASLD